MNDITQYQPQFSASGKRNLDHNLVNIQKIASLTKTALEVQAEVHKFGMINLVDVANQAKLYIQAYVLINGEEDLNDVFKDWFEDLKEQMKKQYQVMGDLLINVINTTPIDPLPPSFWDELYNRLYIMVFGNSHASESPIDNLRRIGMETKRALSDSAKAQLNRLPSYVDESKNKKESDI
jgi:hypothetical protein